MSNTRIPSPARSQGGLPTPRKKRGTCSVGSPARSEASGRLTSIVNMDKNISFAISPLPSRCSVLTDATYIEEPRRKTWWKKADENSREVLDVLESLAVGETDNAIEELIDMDVLSQEKNSNQLDLPESSDSESINSIVLPQRKLFTHKEVEPQNKFGLLIGNRESLAKLHKTNLGQNKTINAGTRNLFQYNKQRTKPVFPAALLSVSPNKTTDDMFREIKTQVPKNQVRNIFGNRPTTKRKNMFAEFILSESEDEIPEIQPKIFGFQKNLSQKSLANTIRRNKDRSPTSSITTDTEMEDWNHLPSSTMVDQQIEEMIITTPLKKPRLSNLSEVKESEAGTDSNTTVDKTKQSNKSIVSKNVSKNSSIKNVSFGNSHSMSTRNKSNNVNENTSRTIITSDSVQLNESLKEIGKKVNTLQNQPQQHNSTRISTSIDINTEEYKVNSHMIHKTTNIESNDKTSGGSTNYQNEPVVNVITKNQSNNMELENNEADENNFTLQYENDDEHSSVVQDKTNELNNVSKIKNSMSSLLNTKETDSLETTSEKQPEIMETEESHNNINEEQSLGVDKNQTEKGKESIRGEFNQPNQEEYCAAQNNYESNNQIEIDNENGHTEYIEVIEDKLNDNVENGQDIKYQSQKQQETISENLVEELNMNTVNNKIPNELLESKADSRNDNIDNIDESEQGPNDNEQSQKQDNESNEMGDNLQIDEEAPNDSVEEDSEIEDTQFDQDDNNEEEEPNEYNNSVENSLQTHNISHEVEEAEDEDVIAEEQDLEESRADDEFDGDHQEHEESENESQDGDYDQVIQQESEGDNDVHDEESADVIERTETPNDDRKSPEVILHDKTNQIDSFTAQGRSSSVTKTKSMMVKSLHIKPSMATARDSIGFSDDAKNSSTENSGWDSHRTTRKTLRQTLGRDFTPRKSLRALVMEKSVKRQTRVEVHSETAKFPQANSTELPEMYYQDFNDEESIEQSIHEVSKRTRQATLEMCLEKIKKKNMDYRIKIEQAVKNSLQTSPSDTNLFKVPYKPIFGNKRIQNKSKPKQIKRLIRPLDDLPPEILEDLKYKPPRRFKPSNASWITKRLYKLLEDKLEAKYDYKARVRAEKLVETIHNFTKDVRRHEVAPAAAVQVLKHEMARLDIVKTHFEFYEFFHEFMPREIRIKVVPDVVNKISMPKHGIFSDIIRVSTV